ncbi:hypothetical protein SAY86_013442 [Trapa natans]|uniref:MADS-box domain-containing protein n=1 Tax=Trapa natans TaxID=22666 RepID=A0AAN7LTP4_TRANT|nr:hypothetical protein SAY86_013442 [Trapa natans]
MPRGDVQLQYIRNPSKRKSSYNKRKKGLLKKAYELSNLCDIQACAVVYHSDFDDKPEVWPSLEEAHRVIKRYRSIPEFDRHRTMMDQWAYLNDRIQKGKERLRKIEGETREKEMEDLVYEALERPEPSLEGITDPLVMDDVLSMVGKILRRINVKARSLGMTSSPQPPPPPPPYIQGSLQIHQTDTPFVSNYHPQSYLYGHAPLDETTGGVLSAGVDWVPPPPAAANGLPNPSWYLQKMVSSIEMGRSGIRLIDDIGYTNNNDIGYTNNNINLNTNMMMPRPPPPLPQIPEHPQYTPQLEYPPYWERRH